MENNILWLIMCRAQNLSLTEKYDGFSLISKGFQTGELKQISIPWKVI